jgi:hypothetical protein
MTDLVVEASWIPGSLMGPRSGHTAAIVQNTTVYIFAGAGIDGRPKNDLFALKIGKKPTNQINY